MQADVNVSLTAISLLWNAADLLSKMLTPAATASAAGTASSARGAARPDGQALGPEEFEGLLRLLLGALQVPACGPELSCACGPRMRQLMLLHRTPNLLQLHLTTATLVRSSSRNCNGSAAAATHEGR